MLNPTYQSILNSVFLLALGFPALSACFCAGARPECTSVFGPWAFSFHKFLVHLFPKAFVPYGNSRLGLGLVVCTVWLFGKSPWGFSGPKRSVGVEALVVVCSENILKSCGSGTASASSSPHFSH